MHGHGSITQLNWPYLAFCLATATIILGFMAWFVTSPALDAAAAGEPLPGGWSWLSVCITDGLLAAAFVGLLWKLYKDAHTQIDAHGISQPSLRGRRQIAWADVQRLNVFRGVGWHVHGPHCRIVVAPYAYRNPQSVIAAIEERVGRRPTRRCS